MGSDYCLSGQDDGVASDAVIVAEPTHPAAQLPAAVPETSEHSVEDRQVPLRIWSLQEMTHPQMWEGVHQVGVGEASKDAQLVWSSQREAAEHHNLNSFSISALLKLLQGLWNDFSDKSQRDLTKDAQL